MDCSQRAFLASQAMYSIVLTVPANKLYQDDGFSMNEEAFKQVAANSAKMADFMMAALETESK